MRFASLHLASLTQNRAQYQPHTTTPTHIAQRQAANMPKHVSIPPGPVPPEHRLKHGSVPPEAFSELKPQHVKT